MNLQICGTHSSIRKINETIMNNEIIIKNKMNNMKTKANMLQVSNETFPIFRQNLKLHFYRFVAQLLQTF